MRMKQQAKKAKTGTSPRPRSPALTHGSGSNSDGSGRGDDNSDGSYEEESEDDEGDGNEDDDSDASSESIKPFTKSNFQTPPSKTQPKSMKKKTPPKPSNTVQKKIRTFCDGIFCFVEGNDAKEIQKSLGSHFRAELGKYIFHRIFDRLIYFHA